MIVNSQCKCPLGASLEDVGNFECAETFGQIQRVAFQRLTDGAGKDNGFSKDKPITALASWTPFLSASDGTKIVMSPIVASPTSEAGAARTFGGGNDTPDGIEEIIGREPTPFSGVFRKVPQEIIAQMKTLQCESYADNLGVYLIDGNGQIEGLKGDADGAVKPIPISSLFIGDKGHGGLDNPDSNSISWNFLPNFSDNLVIVQASFNPKRDLKNVKSGGTGE